MVFELRIYLVAPLDYAGLSIDSTDLHQGVNIPIIGNQLIARIVRAGGGWGGADLSHTKCFQSRFTKVNVYTNSSTYS